MTDRPSHISLREFFPSKSELMGTLLTQGSFEDFFETPAQNSAAPQALGFEGFFRGAYSYHFHNFW